MTKKEGLLWTIWGLLLGLAMQIAYDIYQKSDVYSFLSSFLGSETWGLFFAGFFVFISILLVQREIYKEVEKNKKSSS